MGGPRISDEQKQRMQALCTQGMTLKEIALAVGVSEYAVRTYTDGFVRASKAPDLEDGEVLADIDGYEGLYQVSSFGRVFTLAAPDAPRPIKLHLSKKGGYKVTLTKDSKTKLCRVDELVASKFCDKNSEDETVLVHVDGDMYNSKHDNLTWVKPVAKEKKKRGRARKLTEEDVEQVRSRWLAGEKPASIAKAFNVSYATVYNELGGLLRDIPEPPAEGDEIWAPVPCYENAYFVSSHGRIYSTGGGRRSPKIMSPNTNNEGYKSLNLVDDDGVSTTFLVHRLVAAAFCDGYDEERNIVNHIDGNPSNNFAENLEWCTPQENTRHAISVLGKEMGGSKPFVNRSWREVAQKRVDRVSPLRRFTPEQVHDIRTDPRSARQLARVYGVNKSTIIDIRRGFTYQDLP